MYNSTVLQLYSSTDLQFHSSTIPQFNMWFLLLLLLEPNSGMFKIMANVLNDLKMDIFNWKYFKTQRYKKPEFWTGGCMYLLCIVYKYY